MIFSTVLPGLGQAYNKKYWKIPVVYAGLGTSVYFFVWNNSLYNEYKLGYKSKEEGNEDLFPQYDKNQLIELASQHRRYRDLSAIITAMVYTLNIVDAYVDAHLWTFDVSDDLSMNVQPTMHLASHKHPVPGLSLSLGFSSR